MSDLASLGKFATVYCDPAWQFTSYSGKTGTPHRGAHDHYITTSTEDMKRLPVADVLADDAALFMWVVDSHLPDAIELGRAWGCEFRTIAFVWVKSREHYRPTPGMGYWTRKGSEQVLLFVKGKPKRLSKGVEQMLFCPRGAHSAKPDEMYERIEALVGGPYLELFSRTARRNWTAWGDQVGIRDGLFSGDAA